jgi:endo-1,4-beta-D-glucanase Y
MKLGWRVVMRFQTISTSTFLVKRRVWEFWKGRLTSVKRKGRVIPEDRMKITTKETSENVPLGLIFEIFIVERESIFALL